MPPRQRGTAVRIRTSSASRAAIEPSAAVSEFVHWPNGRKGSRLSVGHRLLLEVQLEQGKASSNDGDER